jgi:hypothetical protein
MKQFPLDLEAIDSAWFALRDDMLATELRRNHHAATLTNAIGRANCNGSAVNWDVGDATLVLKQFQGVAAIVCRHAERVFSESVAPVKIETEKLIEDYIGTNRNHLGYERWFAAIAARVKTVSVKELWERLCERYPAHHVLELAVSQSGKQIRCSFNEFSMRHANDPVQRVGGRAILTQSLYGDQHDAWRMGYHRQDRMNAGFQCLASALILNDQVNAARSLQSAGAAFSAEAGTNQWRFASRLKQGIDANLDLIFFKEKLQFVLSDELSQAVKLLVSRTECQETA